MATNKHAQIRYKVLDSCFRNTGRNYTFEDLINEVNDKLSEIDPSTGGICVRTIRDDIFYMRSSDGWSADIECFRAGRKYCYRYRNSKFSINNQPLNQTELIQLSSALEIISRFDGMPQFEWVGEIVTKINNGFKLDNVGDKIVSFDSNRYLKGMEYFGKLFNIICSSKAIDLVYRPFTYNYDLELVFHPYYLKQYNNRWFLFGLNETNSLISNIALDRIVSFEISKVKYKKNKSVNFDEYFDDIIGVTKPEKGKLTKVELRFNHEQAPYVLTKPIHGSQKMVSHDNAGLTISLEIIPNIEFEKLVLSFGKKVKVLKPNRLANHFKLIHKEAAKY